MGETEPEVILGVRGVVPTPRRQAMGAGRLEWGVRRVGRETMPCIHGFSTFIHSAQYAEYRYCALPR